MTSEEKMLLRKIRFEFRKSAMSYVLTEDEKKAGKALVNQEQCFYCGDFDRVMPYDRGEED